MPLWISACQLSRGSAPDGLPPEGGKAVAPLALAPPLAPDPPEEGKGPHVVLRNAAQALLADVVVPDCGVPSAELMLSARLLSDYGGATVRFVVHGDDKAEAVRAEVEGRHFGFAGAAPLRARLFAQVCAAQQAGKGVLVADAAAATELGDWLELAAPDCEKMTPGAGGWQCRLPGAEPEAARQELLGIQTTMIRRWSRQPYLLARRLAVGITLAHALEAKDVDKALDTFCNIVIASLPIELPATLASKRWQAATCARDSPHRTTAARFGLAKTVAEVDFMRQLFERTSRLGFLLLRIPPAQAPAHEMLVSLTPEADVADNLTRETARLWLTDGTEATPEDLPRACWHPVFAETPALLDLARHLAMAGETPRVACEPPPKTEQPGFTTERYFAESITSETEFVLANGRAKTLRLPIGKYKYTLRGLPENPDDWDDASQAKPRAAGEIIWDAKHPRPVINAW